MNNLSDRERDNLFKWVEQHDMVCKLNHLGNGRFSYSQGSSDSCEYVLEITCVCGAKKEVSICNKEIDV
jgi:hypothetical protein